MSDMEWVSDREYITKDSGARVEFSSGMVRDTDDGKARFDLLVPLNVPYAEQLLTRCAELMARGAVKYGDRNWEKADSPEEIARMKASAARHFHQWLMGETDEDHAAAVVFNLLAAETTSWRLAQRSDPWLEPAPGCAPRRKDLDLLANMDPARCAYLPPSPCWPPAPACSCCSTPSTPSGSSTTACSTSDNF